ncbi:MAG: M23 family metallopeptidase [Cyclobacteriaceae bacterium]|nr:M23 family metallopeptidase [Cyclobacteriaceae bacterium]
MTKVFYYYDPSTSRYTRVEYGIWHKILKAIRTTVMVVVGAFSLFYLYISFFEMPNELKLKNDLKDLEVSYAELNNKINNLNDALTSIEKRDDYVYRAVLGTEPIDPAVRKGGVGGRDRYSDIRAKKIKNAEYIAELHEKIDKVRRKIYIESISQDELLRIANDKQKLFAAIPAIQPISNQHLTALASGFGPRLHPFYKVIKMHQGIDFSAPEGTPIYSTADGVVIAADTAFVGYGKMVIIDHGFGYQTRYAHLKDFIVKTGDHISRGEPIAFVGNTGQSTAPHLHYEVVLNGMQINPIHYFYNDLTPSEYEKIVQLASIQNQSMGN